MNTRNISFSEKKVSKNAVITLVMGIIILIGFVIMAGKMFPSKAPPNVPSVHPMIGIMVSPIK